MQYMVIHDDVTVALVMQIQIALAIDGEENGKHRPKKVKKVWKGGSLECVEAPMIKLQYKFRFVPAKRLIRPTQDVTLESFHIDFDEIHFR